jgi:hypothetical protein
VSGCAARTEADSTSVHETEKKAATAYSLYCLSLKYNSKEKGLRYQMQIDAMKRLTFTNIM